MPLLWDTPGIAVRMGQRSRALYDTAGAVNTMELDRRHRSIAASASTASRSGSEPEAGHGIAGMSAVKTSCDAVVTISKRSWDMADAVVGFHGVEPVITSACCRSGRGMVTCDGQAQFVSTSDAPLLLCASTPSRGGMTVMSRALPDFRWRLYS